MTNSRSHVNVVVPRTLRDDLASARLHPGQAMHEVIREALECWKESHARAGLHARAFGKAPAHPVARDVPQAVG